MEVIEKKCNRNIKHMKFWKMCETQIYWVAQFHGEALMKMKTSLPALFWEKYNFLMQHATYSA